MSQEKNWQGIWELQGWGRIAEDVQVFGNKKIHDRNLHEAMECTTKVGIKLNSDECIIKTKGCSFFNTLYTPEGAKPNPNR